MKIFSSSLTIHILFSCIAALFLIRAIINSPLSSCENLSTSTSSPLAASFSTAPSSISSLNTGGSTLVGPQSGPCVSFGAWSELLARKFIAIASSVACCRFSATCAAMTRWRSAISLHLTQQHSLNRQCRLWPFSHEMTPWFRQRAHLGRRAPFSVSGYSGAAIILTRLRGIEPSRKGRPCRAWRSISIAVLAPKRRVFLEARTRRQMRTRAWLGADWVTGLAAIGRWVSHPSAAQRRLRCILSSAGHLFVCAPLEAGRITEQAHLSPVCLSCVPEGELFT